MAVRPAFAAHGRHPGRPGQQEEHHGDPGFQNKLLLATQHWTMPMWQSRRPDYDAEALSSLHIYIVSGCMAVIRQWITGDFKESEEEISSMLEKLSASTSAGFLQGK